MFSVKHFVCHLYKAIIMPILFIKGNITSNNTLVLHNKPGKLIVRTWVRAWMYCD